MKVIILGCGHACGTPIVGNRWYNCDPTNPKNRRTRPSILIQHNGKNILVDTSPDLRQQMLDNNILDIDAILYTHAHSDHAHGINDVGIINNKKKETIPVYATSGTLSELDKSFGYAFTNDIDHYAPFLNAHEIKTGAPFSLFGLEILPLAQDHGYGPSVTFRINDFAYSTDVKKFSQESFDQLKGLSTWVVDCLKETEHPTHSHLPQTLEWIEALKPNHAVLTHMHPLLDYEQLKKKLPPGVEPAYDGMCLSL
ncbi:MAG: MBL fold metallo-hydrolase [Holosporaceae bacterium]|nr:MAG: MBL fold metallo-hydrolase [Holosporaceae bacterium]